MPLSYRKYIIPSIISALFSAPAVALDVKMSDSHWDGIKVPAGHQCQKFGGKPSSPALSISKLPPGTNLLAMEFSDLDYPPMQNGGHGIIGYAINSKSDTVAVPSFKGHSYELPRGFTILAEHRNPSWDKAGAYMPPCSGGGNHRYIVKIKALQLTDKTVTVLEESQLNLGRY